MVLLQLHFPGFAAAQRLTDLMGAPDLKGRVLVYAENHLKTDPAARAQREKILAKLARDGQSLGPLVAHRISERIDQDQSIEKKWDPKLRKKYPDDKLFRFRLIRTYSLKEKVINAAGVTTSGEVVAEVKIAAIIVRRDYKVGEEYRSDNVSIDDQYEFVGPSLIEKPEPRRKFTVLKGWVEARRVNPGVHIIKDEATYRERFQSTFAFNLRPSPKAQAVDFQTENVVAIFWGTKGTTGYHVKVISVTGDEKETVITVRTGSPQGASGAALTYPAAALAIPKCERVKVIVTGDRIWGPRGEGDFSDLKTEELEVVVK